MRYDLLNFELHRMNISYKEAAEKLRITEAEFILKLYGDIDFYLDDVIRITDLICLYGGSNSIDHFFRAGALNKQGKK
jgi:hypothetical protein